MSMRVATVIATYNRSSKVGRAIRSALAALPGHTVVVVDDASSDDTSARLNAEFVSEIEQGRLQVHRLTRNVGVTGAKNFGYERAVADWVLFLDSDDWYLADAGCAILRELDRSAASPLVFFRCIDERGAFVGAHRDRRLRLDLADYLVHTSHGEALTAVNKRLVAGTGPYIPELRGYEGLGCAQLIREFGPAWLSDVTARVYDRSGSDRLSSPAELLRRMPRIAAGHWRMLGEFGRAMPFTRQAGLAVRAILYGTVGRAYAILAKGSR